jgi:hypothetical protein
VDGDAERDPHPQRAGVGSIPDEAERPGEQQIDEVPADEVVDEDAELRPCAFRSRTGRGWRRRRRRGRCGRESAVNAGTAAPSRPNASAVSSVEQTVAAQAKAAVSGTSSSVIGNPPRA